MKYWINVSVYYRMRMSGELTAADYCLAQYRNQPIQNSSAKNWIFVLKISETLYITLHRLQDNSPLRTTQAGAPNLFGSPN